MQVREIDGRPWKAVILLTLLSIIVLLFLTTPAALLNVVSQSSSLKYFLSMSWIDQTSTFNQFLVKTLIPSLIVLGINELLLAIINLLVECKRKQRYSKHQRSIMSYTFVYFLFNMLLIPGVAANVINNAYEFINHGINDWNVFWKNIFALENGNFFFTLLVNSGAGAFLSGLNVFYILFDNYLSPTYSMITKITQRENEKWMKNNGMLMAWGSFYSMILVFSGIGFIFQ